jgi:hypothetical protein
MGWFFFLVRLSFNVIKKNRIWEEFVVERELTGRCGLERQQRTEWWMTWGAAGPAMLPMATNLGRWSLALAPWAGHLRLGPSLPSQSGTVAPRCSSSPVAINMN